MNFIKFAGILTILLAISSCATFKEQSNIAEENDNAGKKITYSFYIAGGLGNASSLSNNLLLERFKEELSEAPKNSTLVFTGDNITPTIHNWEMDSLLIDKQLNLTDHL